ncbi:MAG TPA: carboxymuconolactone decarboxylase family protein [Acidobacteriota bacterium]|nr:carboxymuconolactone decarboxylase family protein [Acidobacteriota bacterium]
MPRKTVAEFRAEREAQNTLLLESKHKHIQRFFNIDSGVYEDGALPAKTKEMLGLAASIVLRCDDCITYHMIRTVELGVTDAELDEIFAVALIVGGSITIPHLRRAAATRAELRTSAT